jgi:hypothetical protein
MSDSPTNINVNPAEKNKDLRSSFFFQFITKSMMLEMIIIVDIIVEILKKGKNKWSIVRKIAAPATPIRINREIS